jgi:hypothetical protein
MFPSACLITFAAFACSFQPPGEKVADAKPNAGKLDGQAITVEEARPALNKLIESDSFLSDAPFLKPLKERILAENKEVSLLKAGIRHSNPGGHFIGHWGYDTNTNTFSYIAKSKGRDELFVIGGHFLLGNDGKWTARIGEASVTRLSNLFGRREIDKVKVGMALTEVNKALGAPPGAYYSGEMAFAYHGGGLHKSPFTGSCSEFKNYDPSLFGTPTADKKERFQRAWISNDVGIWISFDKDWRVEYIDVETISCPYDYWDDLFGELFGKEKTGPRVKK